jgi:GGDEF domain-containing protein
MTAGAIAGDKEKGLASGMDAYFSKPIKAATLAAMVGRWVTSVPPTRREESARESTPLLDARLPAGLREIGSDEFDSLVGLFVTDGASRVAELRMARSSGDLEAIGRLAHTLKGSRSAFGAADLADLCAELQVSSADDDTEGSARLVDMVDAEFGLVSGGLRDELVDEARIDGLTGIPNRRAWDEETPRSIERARRSGGPLSLAMIDLDRFKSYAHEGLETLADRADAALYACKSDGRDRVGSIAVADGVVGRAKRPRPSVA